MKIQVRCLIDNLRAFEKKKRSGDCEYVEWLVSERRSRINTVLIH